MDQGSLLLQKSRSRTRVTEAGSQTAAVMAKRRIPEVLAPYLLVAPAFILLFIFIMLPLIMTFGLSLTDWNLISAHFNWIGLTNYMHLLQSADFWHVVQNTAVFGLFSVGFTITIAFLLAILLDRKLRGMNLFRGLIFLPYITPMVAVSALWIWLYDQNFGLINWFLGLFGVPQIPWLTQPGWAMAAIIIMKIWKVVGYYTVILIAGLQNIPESLFEAARIDGANGRQTLLRIVWPLLSPYLLFVLIVALIASFQDFDQVYMMTQGGPADSTNMIIFYLYRFGFEFFEVGYASSVAVLLFILLFIITWLQLVVSRKWVHV